MPTQIYVNLPVADLQRSIDFFTALGFPLEPRFSDDQSACIVISDTIFAMLHATDFFSTFTEKPVVDARRAAEVILALSVESREDVDRITDTALASGGAASEPPLDEPLMYSRSFQDPDGHLWETVWSDEE